MTLIEYVNGLNRFIQENPRAALYEVLTSSDSEGNSFNAVYYPPSIGMTFDGEFVTRDYYDGDEVPDDFEENAVCVN